MCSVRLSDLQSLLSVLAENHYLVRRLHTLGVNHGLTAPEFAQQLRDLQPTINAGVTGREALCNIVYGTVSMYRDDSFGDWKLVKRAPSRWWPWLANRNEGDWGLKDERST